MYAGGLPLERNRSYYRDMSDFLSRALRMLRRLLSLRPSADPADPYAYVRHPRNPRTPHRSGAVALEEPEN